MRVPAGHLDHLVHYGGRERRVSTETWTSPILAIGMCTVGSTLRSGPVPTERVPLRDRYINSYFTEGVNVGSPQRSGLAPFLP